VLVTRLHGPFSYVLPWSLFPQTTEVWGRDGNFEKLVVDAPLGDAIPMEGVRTGPRDVQWQLSVGATLWWCEALDGGDPKTKVEKRDRWMKLEAPFAMNAEMVLELEHRAQGLKWFDSVWLVLATEYDRDHKWTRTELYNLGHMGEKPLLVEDRSVNDRYGDPGEFAMVVTPANTRVLRQDAEFVYRIGAGASPEGDRPFLDRLQLTTGRTDRLWQCGPGVYERVVAIVNSSVRTKPVVVTVSETPKDAPNYKLFEAETGKSIPLTAFRDPQPAMRKVEMQLVKYKRKDGVELSATLYLPKDRKEGERLPLFVWAYPLEFTDASTAGQVSGSSNRFTRVRGASQILFALHGYAVMDNAAMPVVGDPETVNDTFLDQIVMNAQAAIDEADRLGVADRTRCAVGGHSYGAFMTANLLAHCDLFKAGIARSGAYNRTLTPFGFQSERRTIWEAPKSYLELSPFLAANKINEPLLLIHGEKDDNTGTFPIQSERMYQAVKGNGGTARLVVLPGEAHGYRARESVLDTVAEMFDWCDRYVRDAKPAEKKSGAPGGDR
jgi:dipeptidyl aminopeptidase/acylaminoacyl peptidase